MSKNAAVSQMRWSFSAVYAADDKRLREEYQSYRGTNLDTHIPFEKAGMDPNLTHFFTNKLK
jgi:hypothetical protein